MSKYTEYPDDDEQYDHDEADECELGICTHCNGSGEGRYDGTRCDWCKGKGEI